MYVMARSRIITGIDVGTYHVKAVIAELGRAGGPPRIMGTGHAESRGMRHGYIVNRDEARNAVVQAVAQASKEAGTSVRDCYLSIGGVGLDTVRGRGETIISRADAAVSQTDIDMATNEAERSIGRELVNKKIIHAIPLSYDIDNAPVMGRPQGMRGGKLAVRVLFITAIEQHVSDLIESVEAAGVEVLDVMASPIAASLVSLTKAQKVAGCVLANIGSETTSIVTFEDNTPLSLEVFPLGASHITHDLALQFKISIDEAEQLKKGAVIGSEIPKKKIDDVVATRFKEIFGLIQAHLKKIDRDGLLPAGIIITGGGASLSKVDDLARTHLKLPAQIGSTRLGERTLKDATWAVAYGLCVWGASDTPDTIGIEHAGKAGRSILNWLKQFLP